MFTPEQRATWEDRRGAAEAQYRRIETLEQINRELMAEVIELREKLAQTPPLVCTGSPCLHDWQKAAN